jgi:hypothetical protein
MIAASHSLVNTMMTEHPGQLLHMDIIGPSRVCSMGGKWYILVIVDDYSRYSCVFFLESKYQVFEHFRLLALRLNNEHPNCLKVDEDISTLATIIPSVDILDPITRSQAQQLNHQVNSFLCSSAYNIES